MEASHSFSLPQAKLGMFNTVKESFQKGANRVQQHIDRNNCDGRISSYVLGFLALVALAIGGYLAYTGGSHYFLSNAANGELIVFGSGLALSVLGIVLAIAATRAKVKANNEETRLLKELEGFKNQTINEDQIFDLLESVESQEIVTQFLVGLESIEHVDAFLNALQSRYFALGRSVEGLPAHLFGALGANPQGFFAKATMVPNAAFARQLLSQMEGSYNPEFVKKLFTSVCSDYKATDLQLFAKYPAVAADFYITAENWRDSVPLIYVQMSPEQRAGFIKVINEKRAQISFQIAKPFALALLADMKEPADLVVEAQIEQQPPMDFMDFEVEADERPGIQAQADYTILIDLLLKAVDPVEEGHYPVFAKFPKAMANWLVGGKGEDFIHPIFKTMDETAKTTFASILESKSGQENNYVTKGSPFAKDLLIFIGEKNEFPNLKAKLPALVVISVGSHNSKVEETDKNIYKKHPKKLGEDFLQGSIPSSEFELIFKEFKDAEKAAFFSAFPDIAEGEIEKKLSYCFELLITKEFAVNENYNEALLNQLIRWPAPLGLIVVQKSLYPHYSKFIAAVWTKMDPEPRKVFIESGLRLILSPVNRENNSPQVFKDTFNSYKTAKIDLPEALIILMGKAPDVLAKAMSFYKTDDILPQLRPIFTQMENACKTDFIMRIFNANYDLLKRLTSEQMQLLINSNESLAGNPFVALFTAYPKYIKELVIDNLNVEKDQTTRHAFVLKIFEACGRSIEYTISNMESISDGFGNPRYDSMLKILIQKASEMDLSSAAPPESFQRLVGYFYKSAKYQKFIKNNTGLAVQNFEQIAKNAPK